jgi:hypothetical protein
MRYVEKGVGSKTRNSLNLVAYIVCSFFHRITNTCSYLAVQTIVTKQLYWSKVITKRLTLDLVLQNLMVEWLRLLLRIRKVPGSNIGRTSDILIEVFYDFPRSLQGNYGTVA